MRLQKIFLKVSNIEVSESFYSSLFLLSTLEKGEGYCVLSGGLTLIEEKKWNELIALSSQGLSDTNSVPVLEVPSLSRFVLMVSMRDDKDRVILGEEIILGQRTVRLLDPDMNLVFVVQGRDEAFMEDEERLSYGHLDKESFLRMEEKMKGAIPKKKGI